MKVIQLIAPFLLVVTVSGFAPQSRPTPTTTTELSMGLFDFLQPKEPKEPKSGGSSGKMDANVFGGRAARITVREDEDNAMWVEDTKTDERKSAKGKGKGKGK